MASSMTTKKKGEDSKKKDDDASDQSRTSTRSARRTEKESNDMYNWTVKRLQLELKKKKIPFSAKLRKKDLQDLLRSVNEEKKW